MTAVVYLAINMANGHFYIGMTGGTLEHRKETHCRDARLRRTNMILHKAIRKYGNQAFEWMIIEECESYEDALKAETRLILQLRPEYNLTIGGRGRVGCKASPETIEKMRAASSKRRHSITTRQKMRTLACSDRARQVKCVASGAVYPSVTEAAAALGITPAAIFNSLRRYPGHRFASVSGGRRAIL